MLLSAVPRALALARRRALLRAPAAAYTRRSRRRGPEAGAAPLLLSVQLDPDLAGQLRRGSGASLPRKGKIKVSPNANFDLALLRGKVEHLFAGLAAAHYKICYKIGEKMKFPRPCASDEDAREALLACSQLQRPLHLVLLPHYSCSPPSQPTGSGEAGSGGASRSAPEQAAHLLPSYLRGMPDPDRAQSFTLVSFFRFRAVPDPDAVVASMLEVWRPFKVLGRVYVAEEGVNAQMAVPTNVLRHFEAASSVLDVLRDDEEEGEGSASVAAAATTGGAPLSKGFTVNCDSRVMSVEEFHSQAPFRALHIRRRRQILVDGFESPLNWGSVQDEMAPREWHRRIQLLQSCPTAAPASSAPEQDETSSAPIILDCRNKYESDVGRFDGAVPLDTQTFQDSWTALETILKDKDPSTPIMTYCTGGIRCVKINAYLNQKMGFKNTFRLKGGIIAYARERKQWEEEAASTSASGSVAGDEVASKFRGVNYVFDERMGERVTADILSQCQTCGSPHDMFSNCRNCSIRFLQCKSCAFDLMSCCSSACMDSYIASLKDEETRLTRKHERAKLSHQAKQKQKKKSIVDKKSFAQPAHVPEREVPGVQQRRWYCTSPPSSSLRDCNSEPAILSYCEMFSSEEPALLTSLRQETLRRCSAVSHRMLCDPLQGRVLSMLSHLQRPHAILELGTFTGYSALCLAEGLQAREGRDAAPFLLTIDSDASTARIAKRYTQRYVDACKGDRPDPREHVRVECITARGAEGVRRVRDDTDHVFDLVFLDANKKGYVEYLQCLMGEGGDREGRVMLSPDALIVADNTLWKGMVLQEVPSLALEDGEEGGDGGRMRELARAMHAFNTHCRKHPQLSPLLLPIRDGLTVARYAASAASSPPHPSPC